MFKKISLIILALSVLTPVIALADDDKHHFHSKHAYKHLKQYHAKCHKKKNRHKSLNVQLGPRPYYLVEDMDEGSLKDELKSCANKKKNFRKSDFSIGHRGAGMQFPEHTRESYIAAARMGAGVIECDVTFTKDKELVCRHSQCDLQTTTNILETPLASECTQNFIPYDDITDTPASAKCCTSDITLEEFKTLKGKMDASNPKAKTVEEYMNATPSWRTDLYTAKGTLMTHKESIELFKELHVKMTPELKTPSVTMPYEGTYTQEMYAQQMINEYIEAGVSPRKVLAQSFNYSDILYWIKNTPRFGKRAIYLDGRAYGEMPEDKELFADFDPNDSTTWNPRDMYTIKANGVNYIAPPMWVLVKLDENNNIVPSLYAKAAKDAGLKIITWTLERSGLLKSGGGWYYQTTTDAINNDGDTYELLDVLAQDVGIEGIFSDWPATVSFYANCKGL